ncbi:MAG: phosphoribosylanthranilate isomerase [Pseudomonadota bacterium]
MTQVKICGISTPETLRAAIEAGARYIGFVFFPPSPRHVDIETARDLALMIPTGVRAVGLFVNPSDEQLAETLGKVQLDMIQLHGQETPARIEEIKAQHTQDIIKAINVREENDLKSVSDFEDVADWLLFDSKPEQATLPGGTGESFDWALLAGRSFSKPWMLSGGLTPHNAPQALSQLTPNALDVSSGVESTPGAKDPAKIKAFMDAVKAV